MMHGRHFTMYRDGDGGTHHFGFGRPRKGIKMLIKDNLCPHKKWILDRKSLGRCVECGAKRQFPVEVITFKRHEIRDIKGWSKSSLSQPDSWLSARYELRINDELYSH